MSVLGPDIVFSTVVNKLSGNYRPMYLVFPGYLVQYLVNHILTSIEGDYFSHFEIFPLKETYYLVRKLLQITNYW